MCVFSTRMIQQVSLLLYLCMKLSLVTNRYLRWVSLCSFLKNCSIECLPFANQVETHSVPLPSVFCAYLFNFAFFLTWVFALFCLFVEFKVENWECFTSLSLNYPSSKTAKWNLEQVKLVLASGGVTRELNRCKRVTYCDPRDVIFSGGRSGSLFPETSAEKL